MRTFPFKANSGDGMPQRTHREFSTAVLVANDGSPIVRENAWQDRQVTCLVAHRARQISDGPLALRDRVEIAQAAFPAFERLFHQIRTMSAYRLALFDLPVALLKVLDNRISDLVLLIFGQRARTRSAAKAVVGRIDPPPSGTQSSHSGLLRTPAAVVLGGWRQPGRHNSHLRRH